MLLAALAVLFITGPDSSPVDDGKVHVRYWHITGLEEQVPYHTRAFNAQQDSIIVETTPIPWQEHEKKILTAVLSGNPPDLISQFVPVAKWASRMGLIPLDEFITRDNFDTTRFFPALWEEMTWQGHVFAIPIAAASYGLFYNKALFRAAGLDPDNPPRTWAELRDYARRLDHQNDDGRITSMGFIPYIVTYLGGQRTAMLMAWQNGAKFVVDGGTRVDMANPAMVVALEWAVDYHNYYDQNELEGFIAGFGRADQHAFIVGKVAMMVLDSSFPDQIANYHPALDYGVALIPSAPGSQTASATGSWWLGIPRGARHPGAAWEQIKFAAEKQVQLDAIENSRQSLFPSNRLVVLDSSFYTVGANSIFAQQLEHAKTPVIVPLAHAVFWREYAGAHERALLGAQTPREALLQAQRLTQLALDKAMEYDRYVREHMDFEGPGE